MQTNRPMADPTYHDLQACLDDQLFILAQAKLLAEAMLTRASVHECKTTASSLRAQAAVFLSDTLEAVTGRPISDVLEEGA